MFARPHAAALALCLGLAVLHTWPIASSPARLSLNWNADAELNEWIVSWIPHALATQPTRLFDGNIFAPERDTLAYSDPLVAPALLGAPLRWLGASPVLTFNLLLLAGLMLTAWSAWFVSWKWTGSMGAGLVAGALAAFNVHLLTRLPHLQAAHAWGLPLAFYFSDRLATRPTRRDGLALALVIAATAATSAYWLALVGVIVLAVAATGVRRPRAGVAIAAAALLGLGLVLPVLLPYARLAASGATRPLEVVAQFSATPAGYFASRSRLDAPWTFATNDVNVLFPGVAALVLAGLGLVVAARSGSDGRRRAMALVVVAAVGILLSLGPATAVYRTLYAWLSPLRGLRAAVRFGFLALVGVSLAAGFGVSWLERRATSRRAAIVISALLLAIVTAEAWPGPTPVMAFRGVPAIYSLLRDAAQPVMLVEVPFYPPDAVFENGDYVLAAIAHWQPLMNGYSGLTPASYRQRAASFWFFPEPWAIDAIKREGATHVMVHLDRFGADAAKVEHALEGRQDLRLVASDPEGRRLYAVIR